ncbi:MAG: hypothetical protein KME22_14170 [Hassallia sp. WJT32-NPBG1]|jgi:hypothetical protein|nr:hypothetical protein [Hassallia sp. WJT32-NPBG1]
MNLNYICSKTKQLSLTNSQNQQDYLLYHIGLDANLITFEDANKIHGGHLEPEVRSRVLTWLRHNANEIGVTRTN